jgi:hypothetical protein
MKEITCLAIVCGLIGPWTQAQPPAVATNAAGAQLTIELRDGSRVLGKSVEDTLSLHSASLGDVKLPWTGIRSIEYAGTNTSVARLTAVAGDAFAVTLAGDALRVETGFGKTEMPVKLIRSVKITPSAVAGAAGTGAAQLSIELRDGSHVVGKGLDDSLSFHSPAMGDLKLTWAGIRSLDYSGTNTVKARLTATNGDVYEIQFEAPSVRVETSFGKSELPVKQIRSVKVSAISGQAAGPAFNIAFGPGKGEPSKQVGPAAVGQEGDFWNTVTIGFNNDHTEGGLKLANGQPSPIEARLVNLGGGWGGTGPGVVSPMMDVFSYPANNQGGNSQVILSHVPPGMYSLYIYGHSRVTPSYYGDYQVTVDGRDYGRKKTSEIPEKFQSTEWVEDGQYVRFQAVEVPEGGKIEILIRPGGQQTDGPRTFADAMISGLQLVPGL